MVAWVLASTFPTLAIVLRDIRASGCVASRILAFGLVGAAAEMIVGHVAVAAETESGLGRLPANGATRASVSTLSHQHHDYRAWLDSGMSPPDRWES